MSILAMLLSSSPDRRACARPAGRERVLPDPGLSLAMAMMSCMLLAGEDTGTTRTSGI